MSLITDPVTRNEPEECCRRSPNSRNPYCLQIDIPHDDPFYGVYGVRCIDFVRGFPGVRAGCRLGTRDDRPIFRHGWLIAE